VVVAGGLEGCEKDRGLIDLGVHAQTVGEHFA
jgi:hypothetical protein